MQLRALDQFHISSVQSETLKPGAVFAVSESFGQELMKKHPGKFEVAEKSQPAPDNKAEPAPSNKSDPGASKTKDAAPDYQALTVAKLKELATERGVELGDVTKKDDIIAALELSDEQGGGKTNTAS
jgi:hypothetical protein